MLRAGRLNKRVKLQRRAAGLDSRGQATGAAVDVASIWAAIEPLSGNERETARTIYAAATHRVTIRARADVTTKHRILYGARALNIGHVANVLEAGEQIVLLCAEDAT